MSSNPVLKYTDIRDIKKAVNTVTQAFESGKTRSIEWRKAQIKQLGFMVQDNEVRAAYRGWRVGAELTTTLADCRLRSLRPSASISTDPRSRPSPVRLAAVERRETAELTRG